MLYRVLFSMVALWQLCIVRPALAAPIKRGVQVAPDIDADGIATLKSWKVNLVRYQLIWSTAADTATLSEYNSWLASALDNFESKLSLFAAQGIQVQLVLQTTPGGLASYSPKTARIFTDANFQARFLTVWDEIALRFKDNSTIWGYDIMNEPAAPKSGLPAGILSWNDLALATAQRIRAIDPGSSPKIIIEPRFGNVDFLSQLKILPKSIKGVVYSPHWYYPQEFTAQTSGLVKGPKKSKLEKRFAIVLKFANKLKKKDPKALIKVDEFSVSRFAPKKDAEKYLKDMTNLFESAKMGSIYHAFREADIWSLEHDNDPLHNEPASEQTDRLKVMLKYFKKNK